MDPRLRTLLAWQLQFHSRRLMSWLYAGGCVIAAIAPLLIVHEISPLSNGRTVFRFLQTVHAILTLVIAAILTGPTTDDHLSGTLGFLKISNLSPRTWVTFRFLAVIITWIPLWSLRLPTYFLLLTLGGVTLDDVLWFEAVQWSAFLSVSALSLMVARYSATGSAVGVTAALAVLGLQAVFYFPSMAVALANVLSDGRIGMANVPWAGQIGKLALPQYFWLRPVTDEEWWLALGSLGLHLLFGLWSLRTYARTVFVNVGTEIVPAEEAARGVEKRLRNTRPSRRVSDDALAWQVSHVHSAGWVNSRSLRTLISLVLMIWPAFLLPLPAAASQIAAIVSAVGLAIVAFKPSDCLARELKGGTLSTLALLPLDGREIYLGWARGARRLARPAYGAAAVAAGLLLFIAPDSAPVWITIFLFTFLVLPEAGFVSNIVARKVTFFEFDFRQLVVNLRSAFAVAILLGLTAILGFGVNRWLGLAVFLILAPLVRAYLIHDLDELVARRVEQEQ